MGMETHAFMQANSVLVVVAVTFGALFVGVAAGVFEDWRNNTLF